MAARWTSGLRRLARIAAVAACCWAGFAMAEGDPVTAAETVSIAVFPFELEDFTAAGAEAAGDVDGARLEQSTQEAREQLLQSGRYSLVDIAGADLAAAKGRGLRNCKGCEAAIAAELGADQALLGVVTKISMTEHVITFRVSDAASGDLVSSFTTNLRLGASDSWTRGVRWLMKNRMLAAE